LLSEKSGKCGGDSRKSLKQVERLGQRRKEWKSSRKSCESFKEVKRQEKRWKDC
jgi:hypothetical protein